NVGTAVVDELCRQPAVDEVIVVARRPPGSWQLPAKARFLPLDVGRDDLADLMTGVDAVVHLAWLFQPTHDPLGTWQVNAVGSARVFEAAATAGVGALVHASSVGAYSPGPGRVVDESWPTHSTPTAAYGREKAYVERVLDAVEARYPAMRVVRMRPGFIFQRASGTEQRRLFAGPLLPRPLFQRGRLPVLPLPAGLRFQALHTRDAARAYVAAVLGDVRGPFNLAADPVIDGEVLADVVGARLVEVPRRVVRGAVATGWHLRAVPADPALLDLVLSLPQLDTTRARIELGWIPTVDGDAALREALDAMTEGAGGLTEPLAPDAPARRVEEVATGVGGQDHTPRR